MEDKKTKKTMVEYIREMSDDKLIIEFKSVYESNYMDCFSPKPLIWEELLEKEIERRGYRITPSVEVVKEEEEEEEED